MPQKAFLTAMREFFGLHSGQTPTQFGKEVLSMPYDLRVWFHEELVKLTGWDVAKPTPPAQRGVE